MSDLNPYVDLDNRTLTDETGAAFTLPTLVDADKLVVSLRGLRRTLDGVRVVKLNVRGLKASIGPTLAPPTTGGAKLRFGGTAEDPQTAEVVAFNATADQFKTALTGISIDWTPAEVILADPACWLVRFAEQTEAAPLQVGTANTLMPRSMVRVRAFQLNGVWWHEVRFIQAPLAFTSAYEEVLPPAPSIDRIQPGGSVSSSDNLIVNEIQQLTLPPTFRGTYVIKWNGRVSAILGIQDGPDEIAAALNGMWDDGKERFVGSNPEDNKANLEFVGLLADQSQNLMTVEVRTFEPGAPTFTLDLETAEMSAALRATAGLEKSTLVLNTGFEIQLAYVEENEDPEDEGVPTRFLTVQQPVKIVREQIYSELEEIAAIDWQRPPSAKDYVPFTPDQVITGQQHFVATIGNGTATAFAIAHNLDTDALSGIEVRENLSGGRLLGRTEYHVAIDSADQVTVTFATAPASNSLVVVLTTAGPASAFQAHTHTIGQIVGLQAALDALGARVSVLEDLLPTGTLVRRDVAIGNMAALEIPDRFLLYPSARLAPDFDPSSFAGTITAEALRALPRPPGLLPAIHDATVTTFSGGTLPSPTEGNVYQNIGTAKVLLPGGLGRRSSFVEVDGFAGYDGRAWYRMTRGAATSKSYFPTDFELELIPPITFESDTWAAGQRFLLEFDLDLALFRATTNAQWFLVIEHGTMPSETSPATTTTNLQDVVWDATPLLAQRIIVSSLRQKRHFGCLINRDAEDAITAEKLIQSAWSAADATPATPAFAVRVRLTRFDTENSVTGEVGYVYAGLTQAKASVG